MKTPTMILIGAAAVAAAAAYVMKKKQPVNTATPPAVGVTPTNLSNMFNVLRQDVLNYIASNVGTQTGELSAAAWPPAAPLGTAPTSYPPAPASSTPGAGGPGAGSGAQVYHTAPAVPRASKVFGFPDVAYLASPANPGFTFTPPLVTATGLQPASGSFVSGKPPENLYPFHSSEV